VLSVVATNAKDDELYCCSQTTGLCLMEVVFSKPLQQTFQL